MARHSKAPSRIIMRIELIPSAKSSLEEMCERRGMTKVSTTSRLIEWFAEQNDVVQATVLGLYPEGVHADVPTMILKRMATDEESDAEPVRSMLPAEGCR